MTVIKANSAACLKQKTKNQETDLKKTKQKTKNQETDLKKKKPILKCMQRKYVEQSSEHSYLDSK
jgi:hypothetical protein